MITITSGSVVVQTKNGSVLKTWSPLQSMFRGESLGK